MTGAEPAVPAMTYGCMYHCTVQTKLNIEQTSVGFTHSHLITDTTISAQQQYHLSAILVDRATEFFHITCSMPRTWLVASTTSLTSGVMTSVMWCLFSRKYSLNLSCKKVGDFKSSCEYRHFWIYWHVLTLGEVSTATNKRPSILQHPNTSQNIELQ